MKSILIFTALTTISCGDILIKDNANGNEVKVDKEGIVSKDKTPSEVKTTTTTTTTVTNSDIPSRNTVSVIAKYTLVGDNALNKNFVAGDFCSFYSARSCYLEGVTLQEYSNGKYKVTISLIDSFKDTPIIISKDVIAEDRMILFMTDAHLESDNGSDRMLWLNVDLEELSASIVYDLAGNGQENLGNKVLDTLYFE